MSGGVPTGRLKSCRDASDNYYYNYLGNDTWQGVFYRDWIAYALMLWYEILPVGQLKTDCGIYAKAIIDWSIANIAPGSNGNYPRVVDGAGASTIPGGFDATMQYTSCTMPSRMLAMMLLDKYAIGNYQSALSACAATMLASPPWFGAINYDVSGSGLESVAITGMACHDVGDYLNNASLKTLGLGYISILPDFLAWDRRTSGSPYSMNGTSGLYRLVCKALGYVYDQCYFWENPMAVLAMLRLYKNNSDQKWLDLCYSNLHKIGSLQSGNGMIGEGVNWDPVNTTWMLLAYTEIFLNNIMHGWCYLFMEDNDIPFNVLSAGAGGSRSQIGGKSEVFGG
jgi:hypothetical protein